MRPNRHIPSSGEPAIMKPLLILAAALSATSALAQTLAPGCGSRSVAAAPDRRGGAPPPARAARAPRDHRSGAARSRAAASCRPAGEAVRFMVREIRFTESAILPAEKLAELARLPTPARELALAELRDLTTRIDEAYRERRVVTARAVIPAAGRLRRHRRTSAWWKAAWAGSRSKSNASTDTDFITRRIGLVPRRAGRPAGAGTGPAPLQPHPGRAAARRPGGRTAFRHLGPEDPGRGASRATACA